MKKIIKSLVTVLLLCGMILSLASCDVLDDLLGSLGLGGTETVDYAGQLKLDMSSDTRKCEVQSVKTYVDGDTTHFYVPTSAVEAGYVKARYLGVNTPESTGKIEEWGKAASNFTRSKLESAVSIYIESDDGNWNIDSTGSRYLLWIWYKPSADSDYRNLNVELLQEGLAIASNSANNRYGETCMAAINQAKANELRVYSKEQDPDFYYGDALPITLKELKTNTEAYTGSNVAVEGVVTRIYNNGAYIESYDEEDGIYYGFYMYYGFNLSGFALEALSPGNRVRLVGSVQYYEAGSSYQISGIQYNIRNESDINSSQRLDSEVHSPAYVEINADDFVNGKKTVIVNVDGEETSKEYAYAELLLGTSVSMKDLVVTKVYTTNNDESSQNGAMTLTCTVNGVTVSVRTAVLKDADGNVITADTFNGKTIDVRGIVDSYDGAYQIRVLGINDVTFH